MNELRRYIDIFEDQITDSWFDKGGFVAFKRQAREPFELADEPGVVNTLEGPVRYPAGYYIMTGPKGERYPISPER